MRDLRALIERVERLDGPSRDVDYEIGCIAIPDDWCGSTDDLGNPIQINRSFYHQQRIGDSRPTASLDAAIALCERMLPGWQNSSIKTDDSEYAAYIWERSGLEFRAEAVRSSRAIALILATLRALEAQGGENG